MKLALMLASGLMLTTGAPSVAQPIPAGQKIGLARYLQAGYGGLKTDLTEAAEKMPEADYGFKPGSMADVRTFGQLFAHVAVGQFDACAAAKAVPNPNLHQNLEQELKTKAEFLKALTDSFAFCDDLFSSLTDANAMEFVKLGQGEGSTKRGSRWPSGARQRDVRDQHRLPTREESSSTIHRATETASGAAELMRGFESAVDRRFGAEDAVWRGRPSLPTCLEAVSERSCLSTTVARNRGPSGSSGGLPGWPFRLKLFGPPGFQECAIGRSPSAHRKFSINIGSALSLMCLRYRIAHPVWRSERPRHERRGCARIARGVPRRRSRPVSIDHMERRIRRRIAGTYTRPEDPHQGCLLDAGDELPRRTTGKGLDEQRRVGVLRLIHDA